MATRYIVIEVPEAPAPMRVVVTADDLAELVNRVEDYGLAQLRQRRAGAARTDPGSPEVAAPHLLAFRRGLDDAARGAGLKPWVDPDDEDDDEDDTPLVIDGR
jgi:hypothetical protein